MNTFYPFTALVGQEDMLLALILNAVDPRIGGVLIRGERGTAKTTAARALASLLPPLRIIEGCRFNCDPDLPGTWCSECKERFDSKASLPIRSKVTPFINLPISATEDRLVGTLDLEKAIKQGQRFFEPGILAQANRGILYIDEVNLMDDHLIDTLLDSAAMGVNIVEREGISFSHPTRYILVGTMNPEEGSLRPQLLDRFGLSVFVTGEKNPAKRVKIITRNLEFEASPENFYTQWEKSEKELSWRITAARSRLSKISFSLDHFLTVAEITTSMGVDGHRPDLVILKTARAYAAFQERFELETQDFIIAANLALNHRLRKSPFDSDGFSPLEIKEKISTAVIKPPKVGERRPIGLYTQEELIQMVVEGKDPWEGWQDTGIR